MLKIMGKKIFTILRRKIVYLNLCMYFLFSDTIGSETNTVTVTTNKTN